LNIYIAPFRGVYSVDTLNAPTLLIHETSAQESAVAYCTGMN